jgi:Peptidase of plants and bacteria
VGRRDRAGIRSWAEGLIEEHGPAVAALVGLDGPLPPVTVRVLAGQGAPGMTGGLAISLSEEWFREHPDDAGCVIHELSHAYMRAPRYDATTSWLIEGHADYVRDSLNMEMPWTKAHFEVGQATAGYQTTADFLFWLELAHPGACRELSRKLMTGTFGPTSFTALTGRSLGELVAAYESDRAG